MNLFKLLGIGGSAVDDDNAHTIDFAPLNGALAKGVEKRRVTQARKRHRKDFITKAPVERKSPPSHLLQELNRKSAAAKKKPAVTGSVTELRRKP